MGLKLVWELSCVALAWQSEGHLSLIGVQRFLQSAVSAKPLRNFQGKNEINHKTFHFKPNSAVCFPMREKTAPRYLERTSWCERRPYSLIGMTCVYVSRPFLFRAMCLNLSDSGHGDFERYLKWIYMPTKLWDPAGQGCGCTSMRILVLATSAALWEL